MAIYYIGDMKFGCKIAESYDPRPYGNWASQDLDMLARWNSVVKQNDTVYILGNVSTMRSGDWEAKIGNLRGRKILVKGPYDYIRLQPRVYHLFDDIVDLDRIYDNNRCVQLCHYPLLTYNHNEDSNVYMIYSQSSDNEDKDTAYHLIKHIRKLHRNKEIDNCGQIINVAAKLPYMDFFPRKLDYLLHEMDSGRMYGEEPNFKKRPYTPRLTEEEVNRDYKKESEMEEI